MMFRGDWHVTKCHPDHHNYRNTTSEHMYIWYKWDILLLWHVENRSTETVILNFKYVTVKVVRSVSLAILKRCTGWIDVKYGVYTHELSVSLMHAMLTALKPVKPVGKAGKRWCMTIAYVVDCWGGWLDGHVTMQTMMVVMVLWIYQPVAAPSVPIAA